MNQRALGSNGLAVSALGLGCMGMSALYGPADEGENLLDTGDYYGAGNNELLIRDALRGRDREEAVLSVKFGVLRSPDGEILGLGTSPARQGSVRRTLARNRRRAATDCARAAGPRDVVRGAAPSRGSGAPDRSR